MEYQRLLSLTKQKKKKKKKTYVKMSSASFAHRVVNVKALLLIHFFKEYT